MDDVWMLIVLCFTMLIGSFAAGLVPLTLSLSESKMRLITILGAGLLIGTALSVIIPEGIMAIYSSGGNGDNHDHGAHNHHHVHKRDVNNDKQDGQILDAIKSDLADKRIKHITNINIELDGENPLNDAHRAIGVTLVLGFVFMLFIDQIGGKFSHRHVQSNDAQAIKSKITFVTTLGLVVHSAADGIALGAAATTSKTDVEMIVFAAIMLHKAPAAFGLVSFLLHEGLDRLRVRRHLTIFALAAPVMAIITFIFLKSKSSSMVDTNSTGLCMLFSAGTFLYVSTVHVLPEVQSHNEDRQFKFSEMITFILGSLMPLVLSLGHSH